MKISQFLKSIIVCLICFITIKASAQKLPTIQEGNMLAPANVKIDGNANEWGNTLQAYNKSTSVFYTLANDKNNLYLVVQSPQNGIIQKIVAGGITLSIEDAAKSKSSFPFSATFPVIPRKNHGDINTVLNDTAALTSTTLMSLNNNMETISPEIKISGNAAISDSTISVYNEYGIKVSQRFDSKKTYTYELAIPLKYISPLISSDGALNYTIKLNGLKSNIVAVRVNGSPAEGGMNSPQIQGMLSRVNTGPGGSGISFMDLTSPTSLSGSYKLAK